MDRDIYLKPEERIDDLIRNGLQIIQSETQFRFALDAVLLAHFATIKKRDVVVDLGTGSGVIPLLLTTRGEPAHIFGLEIQVELVEMAIRSVQLNHLEQQITILQGDLRRVREILPDTKATLVTVNPPYMPEHSGRQNNLDSVTIARHEVYCNLREVVEAAQTLLTDKGRLAIIHRTNRLAELIGYCREFKLEPRRLRLIQPRLGQKPNLVLLEAVKGVKPDLEVLENLIIYQGEAYTEEIQEIYFG